MLLRSCRDLSLPSLSVSRGGALLAAGLMVLSAGCGPRSPARVPVHGEVTVDGGRLKAGVIRFLPGGGTKGPAAVATIRDGLYEFSAAEAPVVGSHRVEIEAIDYYGFSLDDEQAFAENVEKKRKRVLRNPIHENYNRRSTLTAEVRPDGNRKLDFALKRDGRRPAQP